MATYTVTTGTTTVTMTSGHSGAPTSLAGGDILELDTGARGNIVFQSIDGDFGNPIIVRNKSVGQVVVSDTTANGIEVADCQYMHFTGTGDSGTTYGIKIDGLTGRGLRVVGPNANYLEFDHFEITDTNDSGISVRTKFPTDGSPPPPYDFTDISIHDCWVHDIGDAGGGEGAYIGGKPPPVQNDGLITNLEFYNNTVENTSWDCCQFQQVPNARIHHNIIRNSALVYVSTQAGILNVTQSADGAKVYNNWIENGPQHGPSIVVNNVEVYNNVVYNVSTRNVTQNNAISID